MPSIPTYEEQVRAPSAPRTAGWEATRVVDTSGSLSRFAETLGETATREFRRRDDLALMEYEQQLAQLDQELMFGDQDKPGALRKMGTDAFGVSKATLSDWDSRVNALAPKFLTPEADVVAKQKRTVRRQDAQRRLSEHEYGQGLLADEQVTKSSLLVAQNEAIQNATDPQMVKASIARASGIIAAQGKRYGKPAELVAAELAQNESATWKAVIASQLDINPALGIATFKENRSRLMGGDLLAVQAAVRPHELKAVGTAKGDQIWSATDYKVGDEGFDALPMGVRQAVRKAQSEGKEFDRIQDLAPISDNDAIDWREAQALREVDARVASKDLQAEEAVQVKQRIAELASQDRKLVQNAQQASQEFKHATANQLQNTMAKLGDGISVPLPEQPSKDQLILAFGQVEGEQRYRQIQVAAQAAPDIALLKTATPEQAVSLLSRHEARADSPDYAFDKNVQVNVSQAWKDILAQQEADPGAYVLQNSPRVAESYAAFITASEGKDYAAFEQANQRYLVDSLNEQRRLGITKPGLPKAYVTAVSQDFLQNLNTDPKGAVARLAQTGQLLKDAPYAMNQIAKAVGPSGVFAMEGVSPTIVQRLAAINEAKGDTNKLLPTNVKPSDVNTAVARAFAGLTRTFTAQGANATSFRYMEAAQKLATQRVIAGESPNDAASSVYQELVADRYHPIENTYRVPLEYPLPSVEQGLEVFLGTYSPENLLVVPEPGFSAEESAQRKWRSALSGHWVNNATDTGVFLYGADGLPVLTKDNKPLFVRFDSVSKLKPSAVRRQDWQTDQTMRR